MEDKKLEEERQELYKAFKKEKWYTKILEFFGLIEEVDENNNVINNDVKDSYYKGERHGIIYTLIICFLLFGIFILSHRGYIGHQLENMNDISVKLNEMNYFINKHWLYEKDSQKINDMISLAMMVALDDNYSTYYTKEQVAKLNEETNGEYVGVGIVVIQDKTDGYLVVSKIYDESSAKGTSLAIGDKIIKVDETDVTGYETDEVVALVRGKAGTKVNITVLKADGKSTEVIELTRKKIINSVISGKMLDNNIGYIAIDSFEGKAYDQFIEYKNQFETNGIKGLVIDLRNNPGGNLDVLQHLADIFLDNKMITYFEYKNGQKTAYYTKEGSWDIPVVILINEYSASAAEAFTGALKDYKIATVVGTKSYGKGVVQEVYPLTDGSAIKFTIANYYTPNGINITGEGITPDVIVENDETENDNQLNKAIEVLSDIINNK